MSLSEPTITPLNCFLCKSRLMNFLLASFFSSSFLALSCLAFSLSTNIERQAPFWGSTTRLWLRRRLSEEVTESGAVFDSELPRSSFYCLAVGNPSMLSEVFLLRFAESLSAVSSFSDFSWIFVVAYLVKSRDNLVLGERERFRFATALPLTLIVLDFLKTLGEPPF